MRGQAQSAVTTIWVFALLLMLVLSAAAIVVKLSALDRCWIEAGTERIYTQIVVQPGDTLWEIAVSQMPDADPRDAVGRIRELNQLSSAEIFPGQILTVDVKRLQATHLASR
ncbi:MAG: LysM peptidoglycan-binding domain-containing protein [Limnochordia bacterium]